MSQTPEPAAGVREPSVAFVALGANLGDARATVLQALNALAELPQTTVTNRSHLYGTAPIDSSGPDYVNAVASISTHLNAMELLAHLQQLELAAGRERPYRNAPRTLDLDILLFGSSRICSAALEVPHPRMWQRAFVLVPLAELAPDLVPPQALAAVAGQEIRVLGSLPLEVASPTHSPSPSPAPPGGRGGS